MKRTLSLFVWLHILLFILASCAQDLVNVKPDQLQSMQWRGALVVDVRTPEEWEKTGMIPGSKGLTYFDKKGTPHKHDWLDQLITMRKSPDQPLILVCRSGTRSTAVAKMLLEEEGYSRVYQLENGIKGWSGEKRILEKRAGCQEC